jgi:hypothetical protein
VRAHQLSDCIDIRTSVNNGAADGRGLGTSCATSESL